MPATLKTRHTEARSQNTIRVSCEYNRGSRTWAKPVAAQNALAESIIGGRVEKIYTGNLTQI